MNRQQWLGKLMICLGFIVAIMIQLPAKIFAYVLVTTNMQTAHNMHLFYWLLIIVGGVIVFTLTYVSYRKYKGEEEKVKKKKHKN